MIAALRYAIWAWRRNALVRRLEGYDEQLLAEIDRASRTKEKANKLLAAADASLDLLHGMRLHVQQQLEELKGVQQTIENKMKGTSQ